MPSTPLTTTERTKIVEFISAKIPNAKCGLCGSGKFSLLDHLLVPMTSDTHMNIDIGGPPLYPHVGLNCDVCNTTTFVNAAPMGIITKAPLPTPF